MESSVQVDEWSSPPLLTPSSSLPLFDNTFGRIPVDLQPSSSDAASTTTLTTNTSLNSSAGEETSSSLRTTPEAFDSEEQEVLGLAAQVSKQIETEAAEVRNGAEGDEAATTRRRSMRIRAKEVRETRVPTTSTTTSSRTSVEPPTTPHPRAKSSNADTSDAASSTSSSSSHDGSTARSRSLRSSVRKPKEDPKPDSTPQPTPATEPESSNRHEPESTRRTSKRLSAIHALVARAVESPSVKGTKRAHDSMSAGSKSADSKPGGRSYTRKVKVEDKDSSDATSSTRTSEAPSATFGEAPERPAKRRKVWVNQGLYIGQDDDDINLNLRPASKGKKTKGRKKRPNALPFPMFRGKEIMESQRDFKLPYAVFAPSAVKCAPPDWRKLNHNQLIGDAQQIWRREKPSTVKCVCQDDCSESCLNRCTWVECTDNTCNLGRNCKNRSFADLTDRVKSETRFAIGVEVALTSDRGYGLRALRSFEPGQIIVEYTGEIITQEESERRLDEVYKDNTNYYLMLFDQNMILDATRGSVARFVNHSCEPNCTMEKWVVEGRPRMALFAGEKGIEAGDELTYDYNFTWFKGVTQIPCRCGSENCRGILGKRSDRKGTTPPKKATTKATRKRAGRKAAGKERIQQSAIINPVKPKRKPPFPRRPPTPPAATAPESESATPELEPLPPSSDDDSGLSDVEETPAPKVASPLKPLIKSTRLRTRVMKTYKVNKTIAKSSISKTITSKAAVAAAQTMALEEALADTAGSTAEDEVPTPSAAVAGLLNGFGGVTVTNEMPPPANEMGQPVVAAVGA